MSIAWNQHYRQKPSALEHPNWKIIFMVQYSDINPETFKYNVLIGKGGLNGKYWPLTIIVGWDVRHNIIEK